MFLRNQLPLTLLISIKFRYEAVPVAKNYKEPRNEEITRKFVHKES